MLHWYSGSSDWQHCSCHRLSNGGLRTGSNP